MVSLWRRQCSWEHGSPAPPSAELQLGVQTWLCRGEPPAQPPFLLPLQCSARRGSYDSEIQGPLMVSVHKSRGCYSCPALTQAFLFGWVGIQGAHGFPGRLHTAERVRTLMLWNVFWGSRSLSLTASQGELQREFEFGENEAYRFRHHATGAKPLKCSHCWSGGHNQWMHNEASSSWEEGEILVKATRWHTDVWHFF